MPSKGVLTMFFWHNTSANDDVVTQPVACVATSAKPGDRITARRFPLPLWTVLAAAALVWVVAYLALHPIANAFTYDLLRLSR